MYCEEGVNMGNESVEFNEIRCKTLTLGDEETGFINLKVNKIDDSPCLEIESDEANEDSSITIGYQDGKPIISLLTNKNNEKKHIIKLQFDESSMPTIETAIQDDEENYDQLSALGLTPEGTPGLIMITKPNQDTCVLTGILISKNGEACLLLSNENVKGGRIAIRVDDDGGGISIRTNQDSTDKTDSQKRSEGIILVDNSEVTFMDIKGYVIGGKKNLKENTSTEGKSNE